jgi:hypothetical protein
MAYVDGHEELAGPGRASDQESVVLANLNLDMVGEDLERLHSRLILTRSPLAVAGALDAVVADMAVMVEALDVRTPRGSRSSFHWRAVPFSGGSDHMMFLDRGIPSTMFSHAPDYTHHTSEDTPDKVDPVELERCELIAAGAAWYLANLGERAAVDLAWAVSADVLARFDEGARGVRARLAGAHGSAESGRAADDALLALGALLEGAFDHVLVLDPAPDAAGPLAELVRELREGLRQRVRGTRRALALELGRAGELAEERGFAALLAELRGPEARWVQRHTRGPLAFDLPASRLPADRAAWYAASACPLRESEQRFALLNLANLGLPLGAIRAAYAAEHGWLAQADVQRYFEDLQALGLIALRDPTPGPSKD